MRSAGRTHAHVASASHRAARTKRCATPRWHSWPWLHAPPLCRGRYRIHKKLMELHLFTHTHVLIVHPPSGSSIGTFLQTRRIERLVEQVCLLASRVALAKVRWAFGRALHRVVYIACLHLRVCGARVCAGAWMLVHVCT